MKLSGKIWKDKRTWVIWVPCLRLSTQGKTKVKACEMLKDAIWELVADRSFDLDMVLYTGSDFYLSSSDSKRLLGFALSRNRSEQGLTYEQTRIRLNSKSRNEYRAYEKGKTDPTLSKLERLLAVVGMDIVLVQREG